MDLIVSLAYHAYLTISIQLATQLRKLVSLAWRYTWPDDSDLDKLGVGVMNEYTPCKILFCPSGDKCFSFFLKRSCIPRHPTWIMNSKLLNKYSFLTDPERSMIHRYEGQVGVSFPRAKYMALRSLHINETYKHFFVQTKQLRLIIIIIWQTGDRCSESLFRIYQQQIIGNYILFEERPRDGVLVNDVADPRRW